MSTKGKWLTIEQKCEVIAQHRREPGTNYTQLALWAQTHFGLSVPPTRQTVRNIVQGAETIEAKRLNAHASAKGRSPCVRSQEMEDKLQQFVVSCQASGERLTRRLLHARAREILDAMPNAPRHNLSVGWLTRFMKRHGLSFQKDRDDNAPKLAVEIMTETPVAVSVEPMPPSDQAVHVVSSEVEELRRTATKRLREIEKEARELRKYLRGLDAQTSVQNSALANVQATDVDTNVDSNVQTSMQT